MNIWKVRTSKWIEGVGMVDCGMDKFFALHEDALKLIELCRSEQREWARQHPRTAPMDFEIFPIEVL